MSGSDNRLTPWVLRLLAANAVVLLLQQTLITSIPFWQSLAFDPGTAFTHPWTFLTYLFLHGGLWHLLANSLGLFIFGPPVERRMGSSRFIAYYLFCGLGGAVLSLLLAGVLPIGPMVGASGAVLGLAVAFARFHPDATMVLFPVPVPIKARNLVAILAIMAGVGALLGNDNIAHVAHLGGLIFGLLYFAVKGLSTHDELPRFSEMRTRVPVSAGRREPEFEATATPAQAAPRAAPKPSVPDPRALEAAELDRVLDKISATGMASLTDEEKAFLDNVAKRRKA